jgi:hypothetical protein
MPLLGTGERVNPVLDFPSRDRRSVDAIRVEREPPGALHRESATVYDRV